MHLELLKQAILHVCDKIVASVEANIEIVKIPLLEIGAEDNATAVAVENSHLYLEGHITGNWLLTSGTEREGMRDSRTDMIRPFLKEAGAIGETII